MEYDAVWLCVYKQTYTSMLTKLYRNSMHVLEKKKNCIKLAVFFYPAPTPKNEQSGLAVLR